MEYGKEELVSLYILLSRYEEELDKPLLEMKSRIEKELYAFLSVGELERLLDGKADEG